MSVELDINNIRTKFSKSIKREIKNIIKLKEYTKRKLGDPVVTIEITEDQENDSIEDTLQKFGKYHFEGFTGGYEIIDVVKNIEKENCNV